MVHLAYYMEDGACMQAQCVLGYLKAYHENSLTNSWNKERGRYEATCWVGRYENCREQGYVVSCVYGGEQMNFAFYEHRNSDSIHVVKFDGYSINTPTLKQVTSHMENKWDTTAHFDYMEIRECGDYILSEISKFIKEHNEKIKNGGNKQ